MIEKTYGKFFSNLFRLRQESDYEDYKEFSVDEAKEYLEDSKNFVNELTKFIESNIK